VLHSLTFYILVVIFIATLIHSTLGFGQSMVAVPLLALRTPLAVAVPLSVLVSLVVAAAVVMQDWQKVKMRPVSWALIASLFGLPLGILLLARGNDHAIKMALGLLIIGFSIYALTVRKKPHLQEDHGLLLLGAGFVSGILGGAYGMSGPPLIIYGTLRRWTPQHFRATLQGYFLPLAIITLVGYAAMNVLGPPVLWYFMLSLPGTFIALLLGRALNQRLLGHVFLRITYAALIVIGVMLVYQAIKR
jgi:uncharacterized membrane protein YfcA